MLSAVSMYFGGDIVSAADCDYDSSRELGLKCPLCSEAVYLVRSFQRDRGGKTQLVKAQFRHYPGSKFGDDCELRVLSKEGREKIEAIRIERRNQRLELYNNHLWEMFAADRNISRQHLIAISKWYGSKKLEKDARKWHKLFRDLIDDGSIYEMSAFYLDEILTGELDPLVEGLTPSEQEDVQRQIMWFQEVDRQHQKVVVHEIIEFLGTRTSGYAWLKICKATLATFWSSDLPLPEPFVTCHAIAGAIAGTHWQEQIEKHLVI